MIRFAIVTDSHCTSKASTLADAENPDNNARLASTVRWLARRNAELDFVVFAGDLIGDHRAESYRSFQQAIAPLAGPRYFLVGNHDLRRPFRRHLLDEDSDAPVVYEFTQAFPGNQGSSPPASALRGLVLDTLVDGEIRGAVTRSQLDWVGAKIAENPSQPTVVFMHHPPLPTGIDWMAAHPTENGAALIDVLAEGNVRAVFFGHVHMEMGLAARGIPCFGTPATSRQFTDGFDRNKVEWDRPSIRLVTLSEDTLSTYLDRVPGE